MQDTQNASALTRTWITITEIRPYGEYWGDIEHTVTLTRTPAGVVATVDGELTTLLDAVQILSSATSTTVTAQVLQPRTVAA
ncbi:hypothetical protein [Deinococcus hohokamensis]|uniref:Uncharacterized protein n=1 Tax=Deinococcus hohokamensis TaxID=309883 RepID=A0ABV9I4H4_9DEIO